MNKKLPLIIFVQTILIIALFWVLIFYGRDEYEAYQTNKNDEIESLGHVSSKAGVNVVSLSTATQQNSGIRTAKLGAAKFKSTHQTTGNVVAIDSLLEAKAKALNLASDINITRASYNQNANQYQRLKELNADDKNVSDHAVQEALTQVNADYARLKASELQVNNLLAASKLQWGETLAKLVTGNTLTPHLQDLLNQKNVLVQISLPLSAAAPAAGSSLNIWPQNEAASVIRAIYVSPATQMDTNGLGKTFYYSAPADLLRIGMRVNADFTPANAVNNGVIIPNNAVVWYAGKPWAYFKQGNKEASQDLFVRKPIRADEEVEGGWFNEGLDANGEVVVNGAQLLLSEEFKSEIKNENED